MTNYVNILLILKNSIIALISIFLLSCSSTDEQKSIIGVWEEYKDEYELLNSMNPPRGFHFIDNSTVEYYLGFWDNSSKDTSIYLTNYGHYNLVKDSTLIIIGAKDTSELIIHYINNDSILIKGKYWKSYKPYRRINKSVTNVDFDSIVLEKGHGWGQSQSYRVSLSNQSYEWQGEYLFKGKLSKNIIDTLIKKYHEADFINFSNNTYGVDGLETYISFYKKDSLLKEIRFEGYNAPSQLIWASLYQCNIINKMRRSSQKVN